MTVYILVFLFGLIIGSFLNVCVYRIPREISLLRPRSHCPSCGRAIPWFLNIPLAGYILSRGRCRYCADPIPLRYPLIELSTGVCAVSVAYGAGFNGEAALRFVFICCLLLVVFVDWSHMIIPRGVIYILAPVAVLLAWLSGDVTLFGSVGGLLLGGGFLLIVSRGYRRAKKREGLAAADVLLAAILGITFGWKMPLLLVFASVSALVYGLYLALRKGEGWHTPVPYGTFLAAWGIIFCYVRIFS